MKSNIQLKNRAIELRKTGLTYTEIQASIGMEIPKSTLQTWFNKVAFSAKEKIAIEANVKNKIRSGHIKTLAIKKAKREEYFKNIQNQLMPLVDLLENKDIAKIALLMLYWCEGAKHTKGSVSFGNSDPKMINFFLALMRKCYAIDESKFRGTVQCRADQDSNQLTAYWSRVTNIPPQQFYKPRIDARTVGKPSRKSEYKGVCRIDYYSAKVYHELLMASRVF